jgi:potassium efflux system protein
LASLVLGLLIPATAAGQSETPGPEPAAAASVRDLRTVRQQVEADTTLPADVKAKALELYEQAEKAASQAEIVKSESQALERRIESARTRIAKLRRELESPPAPPAPPTDASISALQTLVSQKRAELLAARDTAEEQKAAKTELVQESSTLLARYIERERNVRNLDKEIAALPSGLEPPILQQSRKDFLIARRALEQASLDWHRLRTFNHDLLLELAIREHDVAVARVSSIDAQLRDLDQLLQQEREILARQDRSEAAATLAAMAELPQKVTALAQENAALRAEIEKVVAREKILNESLRDTGQLLRDLHDSLSRIRERIAIYGASQTIGQLLQRRLNLLPSTLEYRQRERERQKEIAEVIDRRIEVEDQRRMLSEVEEQVEELISSTLPELVKADEQALREQATGLMKSKYEALRDLHDAYSRYMTRLIALDTGEREIALTVRKITDFIREELLWIPTLSPLSFGDFTAVPKGLAWLMSPRNWAESIQEAATSLIFEPILSTISLVFVIFVLSIRRRARYRLPQLAEQTRQIRTKSFAYTLQALGYTLVAALTMPALLGFVARLLAGEPTQEDAIFGHAVAGALWEIMVFEYVLSLLFWLTKPYGLGPRHFHWPSDVCEQVHAGLAWLFWLVVPLVFVSSVARQSEQLEYVIGLGRPALMAALLGIAMFIWRLFNRSGPFGEYVRDHQDVWLARLWFVWFPMVLGIPIALCILSAFGYQVAARTLTYLIFGETMFLLVGLRLINDVLNRWFNVAERRSRLESALRQREEARLERTEEEEEVTTGFDIEIPEVDYHELGDQARSVIRMGVFVGIIVGAGVIWGNLVPTLGLLERVELPFSKLQLVDGVQQQLPVNLADLIIGLLILAGTLFVAKNLSGLLEFTFLRRLRLDAGGNYAIVTLCKYTIVAIGVVFALSTIGLQWSKVQWLVAALGVGLGFGLQEIVANFVSGIILLLERPVRIGDIVSVGNADGYISRIRIRATTILTWEKKELIIPNKEFITGQVLNWTLSDSVHRILVNVGVAYGSDVPKALELMKEAGAENENVLADPEPVVTFEAFGNDSLMLYLRSYIASPENRLATVTALHQAVYDKFTEAGIVIAFPQRDVHLDTSKPLKINLSRS